MALVRYSATAAAAEANNVILAKGEPGYVADDDVLKIGDGVRHWNDLEAVGGGGGGGGGGTTATVVAKTSTYTAVSGDVILANASGGAFTITLPTATSGATVTVKKTDSSTLNYVTIQPASGTIEGQSKATISRQYGGGTFIANGTNWFLLSDTSPGTPSVSFLPPTVLKAYVSTPGVNASVSPTITLDTACTAGRMVFAVMASSAGPTLASPWVLLNNQTAGGVQNVYYLPSASNTGQTSFAVTLTGGYPLAATFFEDDVTGVPVYAAQTVGNAPNPWLLASNTYVATERQVALFQGMVFQAAHNGDISAYSNGLAEFSDSGSSGILKNDGASWYSIRNWLAYADGLSGSLTLQATHNYTNGTTGGQIAAAITYIRAASTGLGLVL
jgi:hypothetical protein